MRATANGVDFGSPLPFGDQFIRSQDTSPLRDGSNSLLTSGTMFSLVGDLVMKYWSHNTALDSNGNFLGRDDAGPCALIVFTEGIGINAPKYSFYSSANGPTGSVPTFNLVWSVDLTSGLMTIASTDSSGTPGNVTNNSPRGRAAFAPSGSTVVVTNSLVTAASVVLVSLGGSDATLTSIRVTPAAGSFTVTGNAAATGITKFDFVVMS